MAELSHLTEREAWMGAKGIDVMGTDGSVAQRIVSRFSDGQHYLVTPVKVTADPKAEARLRESALRKLSKAERIALNLI